MSIADFLRMLHSLRLVNVMQEAQENSSPAEWEKSIPSKKIQDSPLAIIAGSPLFVKHWE